MSAGNPIIGEALPQSQKAYRKAKFQLSCGTTDSGLSIENSVGTVTPYLKKSWRETEPRAQGNNPTRWCTTSKSAGTAFQQIAGPARSESTSGSIADGDYIA